MGHELVYLHSGRALLAVHVGLLGNDGGGGALDAHTHMERAALLPER